MDPYRVDGRGASKKGTRRTNNSRLAAWTPSRPPRSVRDTPSLCRHTRDSLQQTLGRTPMNGRDPLKQPDSQLLVAPDLGRGGAGFSWAIPVHQNRDVFVSIRSTLEHLPVPSTRTGPHVCLQPRNRAGKGSATSPSSRPRQGGGRRFLGGEQVVLA